MPMRITNVSSKTDPTQLFLSMDLDDAGAPPHSAGLGGSCYQIRGFPGLVPYPMASSLICRIAQEFRRLW